MAVLALVLEGLAIFGLILFVVLWLMHFMSIIYTTTNLLYLCTDDGLLLYAESFRRLHLNKKATDKQPYSKLPGVSLLKPLKGVDPNLINNLETFFELDYPKNCLIIIFLISGLVTPDTLTDMANQMTEKVGLVHGLPYVADRQGFAATLEQVYFGTSHPRSYISANLTGFKCVTGMSCLMRKDVLDQAGGLIAFAQYIAEDYFMAKAIADR
ncbi:UNVERIFIED_CONTAM: hypothetical protein H355_003961 [Colinus virginianus]|nr:hypothetical protein H355_003961 [Colinus virginianus]